MNNKHLVYKATSPSGKSYIGVTNSLRKRKWKHLRVAETNPKLPFHCAIAKYGVSSFIWTILADNLSEDGAYKLEIEYITHYNTTDRNHGYNIQNGGEHLTWNDEIRKRHKDGVNSEKCLKVRKKKYEENKECIRKKIGDNARQNSIKQNKSFIAYNSNTKETLSFNALFEVDSLGLNRKAIHQVLSGITSYYKGWFFKYVSDIPDINLFTANCDELIYSRYERAALTRLKASGITATHSTSGEVKYYKYIGDFQKDVNGHRPTIIATLRKVKKSYKGWILDLVA